MDWISNRRYWIPKKEIYLFKTFEMLDVGSWSSPGQSPCTTAASWYVRSLGLQCLSCVFLMFLASTQGISSATELLINFDLGLQWPQAIWRSVLQDKDVHVLGEGEIPVGEKVLWAGLLRPFHFVWFWQIIGTKWKAGKCWKDYLQPWKICLMHPFSQSHVVGISWASKT